MSNIVDRQTFVFSINLRTATSSQIQTFLNLRFSADELIVKSIAYNVGSGVGAVADASAVVQIGCNQTNDSLIGAFANNLSAFQTCNSHFRLNNSFQTGNFVLQFQTAGADTNFHYNPTELDTNSHGVVAVTIEFVKLKNKEIY